jgi:hypothetical protein
MTAAKRRTDFLMPGFSPLFGLLKPWTAALRPIMDMTFPVVGRSPKG